MKRVFITGGLGFVGSHVVEHLFRCTDWEIVVPYSLKHMGDPNRRIVDSRINYICWDLTAPLTKRIISQIGYIDCIINIASESSVDRSLENPTIFINNNVNLVLNMLEYAREIKPEMFIQLSTDEVYGPAPDGIDFKEWSPILPSNPYAASKSAQEEIAISYWRSFGVPVVITNTMNMFGEKQDPEKFIPMCISKIARGGVVTVHGSEHYIGRRKYLHARNMADALLFLINRGSPTYYHDSESVIMPDRYNIVGDAEVSNLEMAKTIAHHMGKRLNFRLVDFHAARPGHDRRYSLDGSKIKLLGWKAPVEFEDSLKKTIQWTLEHKEWLI